MTKIVLLATVAVLVLSSSAYSAAPTLSGKSTPQFHITLPHNGAKILYSQSDNDNGIGIVSQDFEPSLEANDSQGADDFTVKKGEWHIKQVNADGAYIDGSGPARSYDVTFYKDTGGIPGAVVDDCHNAPYADTGVGSPAIECKVSLRKGKYWVSVQANMDFSAGGEWDWNTNNTVRGSSSMWRNPGDGFDTGCTAYTKTMACIKSGEGGDFSFALSGRKGD